jgi:hypothetical protein
MKSISFRAMTPKLNIEIVKAYHRIISKQSKTQLDRKEVFVEYSITFDSVGLITAQEPKGYSNH